MRYHALATDFDGTLAEDGVVPAEVIAALEKCRAGGRRLIMVTGRELAELREIFPHLHLFEYIVVENGATLFNPGLNAEHPLAPPPAPEFVRALKGRNVFPLSVGNVIVATRTPHENAVLEVIRDLGLELQVIFNKGAVMILPSGINKATGLLAALTLLKISPHNVVAVGDAENDHALLTLAELGVAVANSVPLLAERADWVTQGPRGQGVIELIESLLKTDFRGLESKLRRHDLTLGQTPGLVPVKVPPYESKMALYGLPSAERLPHSRKQQPDEQQPDHLDVADFVARIAASGYQTALILPDGPLTELFKSRIHNAHAASKISEGLSLLEEIKNHVIFNPPEDPNGTSAPFPPGSVVELLKTLESLRTQFGRPHWILLWDPSSLVSSPEEWDRIMNLHPSLLLAIPGLPAQLPPEVQSRLDLCICFGEEAATAFRENVTLRAIDTSPAELPTADENSLHISPLRTFWSRATSDLFPIQLLRNENIPTPSV